MLTTAYPPILEDKVFFIRCPNKNIIEKGVNLISKYFSRYYSYEDLVEKLRNIDFPENLYIKNGEHLIKTKDRKIMNDLYNNGLSYKNLSISFSHNPAYNPEYTGIKIRIQSITGVLMEEHVIPKENISPELTFSIDLKKDYYLGSYYKYQLSYDFGKENNNYRILQSDVGLIKPFSFATTEVLELNEEETINLQTNTFTGHFSTNGDYSEPPVKHRFEIRKKSDNSLFASSGDVLHKSNLDSEEDYYDTWTLNKNLIEYETYIFTYKVITLNGYEAISPSYEITKANTIKPDLNGAQLRVKNNFEEGCVDIDLIPSPGNELLTGHFEILRSSEENNWEKILRIDLNNSDVTRSHWKDFTVEQGKTYIYAIQQYTNVLTTDKIQSEPVKADFEDIFLFDGERSLKIRFNPQVNSFKNNIQEQKTDTLGGKYPFIFRNDILKYKEFSLGGLISYREDNHKNFLKLSELGIDLDQELNLVDRITAERIFKLTVQEWLNDGKPKLFRSPQEGNYLIYLSQVNLTPYDGTSREVHSFSCTAYEIAENNYDNLIQFNFLSGEKIQKEETLNRIKTISLPEKSLQIAPGLGLQGDVFGKNSPALTKKQGVDPQTFLYTASQARFIRFKVEPDEEGDPQNKLIEIDFSKIKFGENSLEDYIKSNDFAYVKIWYGHDGGDSRYSSMGAFSGLYKFGENYITNDGEEKAFRDEDKNKSWAIYGNTINYFKKSDKGLILPLKASEADSEIFISLGELNKNQGYTDINLAASIEANSYLQGIRFRPFGDEITFEGPLANNFLLFGLGFFHSREEIEKTKNSFDNTFPEISKDRRKNPTSLVKSALKYGNTPNDDKKSNILFDYTVANDRVNFTIKKEIQIEYSLINEEKAQFIEFLDIKPGTVFGLSDKNIIIDGDISNALSKIEIGASGTLTLSKEVLENNGYLYVLNDSLTNNPMATGTINYTYSGEEIRPNNEKIIKFQYIAPEFKQFQNYSNGNKFDVYNTLLSEKEKEIKLTNNNAQYNFGKFYFIRFNKKDMVEIESFSSEEISKNSAYIYYNKKTDQYASYNPQDGGSFVILNHNPFEFEINSYKGELKKQEYIIDTALSINDSNFNIGNGIIVDCIFDGTTIEFKPEEDEDEGIS